MSKEMIEQIATQIVNEQILQNWKFYLILVAVTFLASAASSFVISYFKERGKNFATKADIAGVLQKIEGTETIKAQISDDFVYKSTRRNKLEELFQLIYEFEQWHPAQTNRVVTGGATISEPSPISNIEMLVSIYFPDCIEQTELLKQSDLPVSAFNLEMEAKSKEFDGHKFIECMQPVKLCSNNLRESLLATYGAELRL